MSPRFFLYGLLLAVSILLQACCGSGECDCQDGHADALALQFDTDSAQATGFRSAELDTVVLIRRARSEKVTPRADTVRVVRPRAAVGQPILLERRAPFPARDSLQVGSYTYSVILPRATPPQRFELTQVVVQGNFEADGCCTCYRNRQKTVALDGQPLDLADPAGNNALRPLLLRRR